MCEDLRADFHLAYPVCPDCGTEWDMDRAMEEEGITFGGDLVLHLAIECLVWAAAADEGDTPPPHPTSDGLISFDHFIR